MQVYRKSLIVALLSIIAVRLCCIIPFLAIISGFAGGATMFSAIEPYRPLLIAISISILVFGFYQAYKTNVSDNLKPCCKARAGKKNVRNMKPMVS